MMIMLPVALGQPYQPIPKFNPESIKPFIPPQMASEPNRQQWQKLNAQVHQMQMEQFRQQNPVPRTVPNWERESRQQVEQFLKQQEEWQRQKRIRQAWIDQLLKVNPASPEEFNDRGNAYIYNGHYDRAIEDYSRAIDLNRNISIAFFNRGNAFHSMNQLEKAIADYTEAINIKPNYIEAYVNRGLAYSILPDKPPERTETINNPDRTITTFYYGVSDHWGKASRDYNLAIEMNPPSSILAIAYYNREVLRSSRVAYWEEAIKDYQKAIEMNPNFFEALCNLARLYENYSEHDKAIQLFMKAIPLRPYQAETYFDLARVLQGVIFKRN